MKRLFTLILCVTLFISGCTSNVDDNIKENISTSSTTEPTTVDAMEENSSSHTTIVESTSSPENKIVGTDLFESIYSPYAEREKSFTFSSVKKFVQSTDYDVEIMEPTSDDLGMITVSEPNGDYVSFIFNPINGIETIMTVSYFCDEKQAEVSMSNYSSDGSPNYDYFETHTLGKNATEVKSLNEAQTVFTACR